MSRRLNAFIFDLDGVLTDTAEFHFLAWKRLADEEGLPFTRQDNEALRGVSRRESLALLLKGRHISNETASQWMERKNTYYREMLTRLTPLDLLPGAGELLAEIRQVGMKIAVASASRNAATVLDYLNLWDKVDALCDGASVSLAKPAPDLFLCAAARLELEPRSCIVVEDAQAGVLAGRAAGMLTIGLGPPARVGEADLVLPRLEGQSLASILSQLEKSVRF